MLEMTVVLLVLIGGMLWQMMTDVRRLSARLDYHPTVDEPSFLIEENHLGAAIWRLQRDLRTIKRRASYLGTIRYNTSIIRAYLEKHWDIDPDEIDPDLEIGLWAHEILRTLQEVRYDMPLSDKGEKRMKKLEEMAVELRDKVDEDEFDEPLWQYDAMREDKQREAREGR